MKKTVLMTALAALACCLSAAELRAVTFTYKVRSDGNLAIISVPKSTKGAVSIPAELVGKKVVALQGAFNGCKNVTSITVPATVKEIGNDTFKNTAKLKTLTFADGSAGVYVGADAFNGSKLKTLALPAGSTVNDYAFYGSKITSLEVNDDSKPLIWLATP